MIELYKLLPEIYHVEDEKLGFPLRRFLEPLQAKLKEIYEDEKLLRLVQDPDHCREDFLQWIAQSLGWSYMSTQTEHRRVEAKEIVNFHDLKGTVYAMRLLSWISFGPLFQRLYEFRPAGRGKHPGSISEIQEDYAKMNQWFRYLIEGSGDFTVKEWKERKIRLRGKPYGFDPRNPYWAYCVYLFVTPQDYVPGTVRPRYEYFIRNYQRWHPAGRFCYVYIHMPFFREEDETAGDHLVDELTGALHWDSYWRLDEGIRFDEFKPPVHPSISHLKVKQYKKLDTGKYFDEGWRWDETVSGVHIMIELD